MWPIRSRRTFALGDLDAAAVADLALIADALVLAAVALPVLGGTKNPLAEQAVALRLQGAVVDGLRLLDLAVGPLANLLRGGEADFDRNSENVVSSMIRTLPLISGPLSIDNTRLCESAAAASGHRLFCRPPHRVDPEWSFNVHFVKRSVSLFAGAVLQHRRTHRSGSSRVLDSVVASPARLVGDSFVTATSRIWKPSPRRQSSAQIDFRRPPCPGPSRPDPGTAAP